MKVNILILGPNTNAKRSGAILRKYIAGRCKGWRNAIYGERKDLVKAFESNIGKYGDLCTYELDLATWVDALIIVPDSAGSLVELGLFSLCYDLHPNTLVIFSSEYNPRNRPDFMGLGPKKAYDNGRAFVETVDYGDRELVWEIVDEFLSRMRAKKFSTKRLRL